MRTAFVKFKYKDLLQNKKVMKNRSQDNIGILNKSSLFTNSVIWTA